VTGD
jgi:hypothetical protein